MGGAVTLLSTLAQFSVDTTLPFWNYHKEERSHFQIAIALYFPVQKESNRSARKFFNNLRSNSLLLPCRHSKCSHWLTQILIACACFADSHSRELSLFVLRKFGNCGRMRHSLALALLLHPKCKIGKLTIQNDGIVVSENKRERGA